VVLSDGLGTTRATVDGAQAITSTLTTEAFGNAVAQWGSSANPYRFAGAWGYRDDGDAGLLRVGARYYDPQVGRFLSRDVVLSEHPYLYCEHEPVNSVDPSGRIWGRLVIWVIGSFAGKIGEYLGVDPEYTWPIEHFAGEVGDDLMNEVGLAGFGSAFGAATTFIGGMDALADGVKVVVKYRLRVEDYMDENGRWD
jgi:RHS repeat-associated protein